MSPSMAPEITSPELGDSAIAVAAPVPGVPATHEAFDIPADTACYDIEAELAKSPYAAHIAKLVADAPEVSPERLARIRAIVANA